MKVACDICEKVEDMDRTSNWLIVSTNHSKFLLCDKCEDKFWNIFKKKERGYNQALEDAEKRYREWSKSEYGKIVADDVLPIRVLRSLRK